MEISNEMASTVLVRTHIASRNWLQAVATFADYLREALRRLKSSV
jgi:hypothetical protein